tara:strand:+ start:57 stop:257 length:201 start_codon:yes stop_codon:yes gene_type:complete
MTYHPIMGITFFLVFLIIAFLIGKKTRLVKENSRVFYLINNKKINNYTDSINPDADWLLKKKYKEK